METKRKPETKPRKRTSTRILKWALAILVILIALAVVLTPIFVSSDNCRQIILAKINKAVAGQTNFSDLSMGWFRGVKVADLTFEDSTGQLSVQVKQIATKPNYAALLTGSLSFGETTIDQPKVQVNLGKRPIAQPDVTTGPAAKVTGPIAMPVDRIDLVVKDGSFRITDPKARTVELVQINSKVNLRPTGQQSSFDVTMAVADAGKASQISAVGAVTPGGTKKGWTLKGTSGNLSVEVKDLDLESLEPFFALAGVDAKTKGILSADIKSQIKEGQFQNMTGTVKGKNLDVSAAQLKGDRIQTAALDIGVNLSRQNQTINIDSLKLKTDWADLTADGALPTTLKSLDDLLKADSTYALKGSFNVDVAALSSQMPKTIGLKEGTKITAGRLTGNVQTASQADRRQITAQASLEGLKGTVEGKPIALSQPLTANAQVSSAKAAMSFDKLDVTASFAKINCAGTAEQISYDTDINLARLQSELGQFINIGPYKIAGSLLGKGQVLLKESNVTISGTSLVKDLNIAGPNQVTASMPAAEAAYALNVDKKGGILNLDSVNAKTSFGQFSVNKGVVPLDKKAGKPMNLVVNASDVDLAKVRPFAVLFASFPKDTQLAGIMESSLSVTSEKDIYKIRTDSTKIRGFTYAAAGKSFQQKEVLLVADLDVNPAQQDVTIRKMQLLSDQIKADFAPSTLSSKDKEKHLQGQASLQCDWAALVNAGAAYLPKGLQVQGQRTVALNFASHYPVDKKDMLLANLNTNKFKLGFDKAAYLGLNVGTTDINLQVANGVLKIEPFSTTVNNGQADLSANADFTKTPRLLTAPKPITIKNVQINEAVSRELLAYVNPIFANAVDVTGVASFGANQLAIPLAGTDKKAMTVVGVIAIDSLKLRPAGLLGQIISLAGIDDPSAQMRIHPTTFTVQNGFVRYEDMQLDIGSTPINFKGAIGLDKSLDMTVTLPLGSRGLKIGKTAVLKRIPVSLTGTVDKPVLDLKSIERELPGMILEGVLDGLLK